MTKEQIQIGQWIIWDEDTFPHPRQIVGHDGHNWLVNGLQNHEDPYDEEFNPYITDESDDWTHVSNIKAARLCREDEIPEPFKKLMYEIY